MTPETLTTEALESHFDAVTAANALKLSAFLAGRNLLKLKRQFRCSSLGSSGWTGNVLFRRLRWIATCGWAGVL